MGFYHQELFIFLMSDISTRQSFYEMDSQISIINNNMDHRARFFKAPKEALPRLKTLSMREARSHNLRPALGAILSQNPSPGKTPI